uniref:Uncharacterized protein n=1 Tax=Mustela putorius furo TaxID=9669 RepID=M3Y6H6_MUSPF
MSSAGLELDLETKSGAPPGLSQAGTPAACFKGARDPNDPHVRGQKRDAPLVVVLRVSAQRWKRQVTIPRSSPGGPHRQGAGRNTPHAKGCARPGSADAKFRCGQNGWGAWGAASVPPLPLAQVMIPGSSGGVPRGVCFSLCLCPFPLLVLLLCLSQVNK